MTCKEMARRLQGTGITVLVAHPGLAVTDHFGKSDSENKFSSKLIETYANSPIGQTAEGGAIPLEFACTAEQLEGTRRCHCSSAVCFVSCMYICSLFTIHMTVKHMVLHVACLNRSLYI